MQSPTFRYYTYYHCTRTRNAACRQKCLSGEALDQQVAEKVKGFGLPAELRTWGLEYIEILREHEIENKRQVLVEKRKQYERCVSRLENLVKLKTSPENADGSLLSDEEYLQQRSKLLKEKGAFNTDSASFEAQLEIKCRTLEKALDVAVSAKEAALSDDLERKREILGTLGLNHVLKDKSLEIKPEFPFSELPREEGPSHTKTPPIEPDGTWKTSGQDGKLTLTSPRLERGTDEDRTKAMKTAMEVIWKNIDLSSPIFKRFPFVEGAPVVPILPRGIHRKRLGL